MGEGVLVRSWCLSVCAKVARLLQKYDLRSQSIEFRQQCYSPHEEGGSGLGSEALPPIMLLRITQAAQPSRLGCAVTRAGFVEFYDPPSAVAAIFCTGLVEPPPPEELVKRRMWGAVVAAVKRTKASQAD